MGNFFKNKDELTKEIFSHPSFLGNGKFKLQLKKITYVEKTARNEEEGVSMTWTCIESDNPSFKEGVDYCVLFFIKHFGLANFRKFLKEAVIPNNEEWLANEAALLQDEDFIMYFIEGEGKGSIEGLVCDVVGTPKITDKSKKEITTFRYSPFYSA